MMDSTLKKIDNFNSTDLYLFLEKVNYSESELELNFIEHTKSNLIQIIFDFIYSFRITDEGNLFKMLNEYDGDLIIGAYVTQEGELLKWFQNQSYEIHPAEELNLYIFVTQNEIIEVISNQEPKIKHYTNN